MLKKIYVDSLKILAEEYSNSLDNCKIVEKYLIEKKKDVDELNSEIKNITYDKSINMNDKYNKIEPYLLEIEKIVISMNSNKSLAEKEVNDIKKKLNILIDTCLSDQSNLTKEYIVKEFNSLVKK